jgi:hypothetical protein
VEQDEWLTSLKRIHAQIRDLDHELRRREETRDFGETFLDLARARTKSEDERAALKRAIDDAHRKHDS